MRDRERVRCKAVHWVSSVMRAGVSVVLLSSAMRAGAQWPCLEMICSDDVVVECQGAAGAHVQFPAPQLINQCQTQFFVDCSHKPGDLFPLGETIVTCTAYDPNNQVAATCEFRVYVVDIEPPEIFTSGDIMVACQNWQGAQVYFQAGANDTCSGQVAVSCDPPSGAFFPNGTTVVTCEAEDASGNRGIGQFKVSVTGECGVACIQLSCPPDRVLDLVEGSELPVQYSAQAQHLCGGNVTVIFDPPSGAPFPVGVTRVMAYASDEFGNEAVCTFSVTVRDRAPPSLLLPGVLHVPCDDPNGSGVAHFTILSRDNVDPAPQVTSLPASGSRFNPGTNLVHCMAVDQAGNVSTGAFRVVVGVGTACGGGLLLPDELAPDNWGFELGLTGWAADGAAFAHQPIDGHALTVSEVPELANQLLQQIGGDYWKGLFYPVGHKGDRWISSAHASPPGFGPPPAGAGDERTGILISKPFVISKPYLSFLIGGDAQPGLLSVDLVLDSPQGPDPISSNPVRVSTGHGEETLRRDWWNVASLLGQRARIRIRDQSVTGHLNLDDFRFQDHEPSQESVTVGPLEFARLRFDVARNLWRDWDFPIWGAVDMHTHPMSHLGFGQKVFHGEPDGAPSVALRECGCSHSGPFTTLCGNFFTEMVLMAMDSDGPNPHREGYHPDPLVRFTRWPVFSTISHQQMWHEWLRRAHGGGLRVMVALCVNNQLLGRAALGSGPFDDQTVGDNQIQALKDFVDAYDFMEIAYDPAELRSIVARGNLAIIIGSELDDIGNFNALQDVTPEMARAEIRRLHDQGVRYIFPVHLINNRFGGAAVYNQLFNVANKFGTGAALQVVDGSPEDGIDFRLEKLDLLGMIPWGEAVAFSLVGPAILPALASPLADIIISTLQPGFPPGAAHGTMGLLAPAIPAALGTLFPPAAAAAAIYLSDAGIPLDVLPIGGNYPNYSASPHGHKNVLGLTPLGRDAVREMMRLGMIIDIDHLSQQAVDDILALASEVDGLYPLNSGHNTFRDVRKHVSENNRTVAHLDFIRASGGVMGIGYGNEDMKSVDSVLPARTFSESTVPNNCAGTSRSFAQSYLYALEQLRGCQVALGTDVNGFVVGPGPRFGPQSAFGVHETDPAYPQRRADEVRGQWNGVAYTPRDGTPILGPAFDGRAVDPDAETQIPRYREGYQFNKEQRDFFVAISIFKSNPSMSKAQAAAFEGYVSDHYERRRVKEFLIGLLIGVTNEEPGSDIFDGDVGTKQQIAKAVYRFYTLGEAPGGDVLTNRDKARRYELLSSAWRFYHRAYGDNEPLVRCQTEGVQWDINFQGVAHYGLLPDFFQELRNVGLSPRDLSPLFLGAECFARMWTHSLERAGTLRPRFSTRLSAPLGGSLFRLGYIDTAAEYVLEYTPTLIAPDWKPVPVQQQQTTNGLLTEVEFFLQNPRAVFRLRKAAAGK